MTRQPRTATSFLAELMRRRVFRVTAVYGAVAFAVIQAADIAFPRLGLPDWTVTFVVALLVLGFPVALVLAWAFELTPEGVRRTAPAAPGELAAIVAEPRAKRWPAGILALVGIVLLVGGGWWALDRRAAVSAADAADPAHRPPEADATYGSIAVLPFANMSPDPENEYFGDGLAEELLNALAGIDGLRVAARTSAFAFKGKGADVREIGRTLGVETVLEGSVRRAGDRVRITAQLIDAADGFHVWSNEYDRRLTDIFAVQDEISRAIVAALAVPLGAEDAADLYRGGTEDVEAYDAYLAGRQRWATRQVPALWEAKEYFETAIARDSGFALAWSGLADAIDALAWRDPAAYDLVPRGFAAARRALELAPDLAEAHASLGVLAHDFERDWATAERALRKAIALKPSYASAHHWLGDMLRNSGRVREAIEEHRVAVELDPLSATMNETYAFTLAAAGRWEDARRQWRRTEQLLDPIPGAYADQAVYGRALGLTMDELTGKVERWAELVRRMAAEGLSERRLARFATAFGDGELAIELLERAYAAGDPTLMLIGVDPAYDDLRADPRFVRIVEALGVPNGYDPATER